jgi:hypothetical protein
MFKPTNVDKILNRFNQTVSDLRALSNRNATREHDINDRICAMEDEQTALSQERTRADKIANQIESLLK